MWPQVRRAPAGEDGHAVRHGGRQEPDQGEGGEQRAGVQGGHRPSDHLRLPEQVGVKHDRPDGTQQEQGYCAQQGQ